MMQGMYYFSWLYNDRNKIELVAPVLQYAHRKCIQRWCNEKGDTICEICLQVKLLRFMRICCRLKE